MTMNTRLLLIGTGWAADSLFTYLKEQHSDWEFNQRSGRDADTRSDLVIWLLAEVLPPAALHHELQLWQVQRGKIPMLLVLPTGHRYEREWLLQLPVDGLLDQPSAKEINEALAVLSSGGRVVQLQELAADDRTAASAVGTKGLGHWLFSSGSKQIDQECFALEQELNNPSVRGLKRMLIQGRLRELGMARELLGVIWGQPQQDESEPASATATSITRQPPERLEIVLANRQGVTVLETVEDRLARAVGAIEALEGHGALMALEALNPNRRRQLFEALLDEFRLLSERLKQQAAEVGTEQSMALWHSQQPLLRQRALQHLVGAYTQMPRDGELVPIADALLASTNLTPEDPELADLLPSLMALIEGRPLLIDGNLLAADEPAALLHLQQLMSNWLVRNAELISRELLNSCSSWPELRRSMLMPELLSTRQLDRQRNRINSFDRWQILVERPMAIYESRRLLYDIGNGQLEQSMVRELRDGELRQLSWWQQVVTLLLETRDALAPQVELLINRLGSLTVLLLTRVLGRAIGLIGRGVLQGLGRGLQNAGTEPERL